ncbi:hypothetical protein HDV63DRAFT_20454 [Trichoderma sp. SZMC 28014]
MTEIWRRSWYLHASCSTGFEPLTVVARSNWKMAWGKDGGPFGTSHCVASRLLACSRSHLGCGYTVTLPSARRSDQPLHWTHKGRRAEARRVMTKEMEGVWKGGRWPMVAPKGSENNSVKRPRGAFPSSLCSISSVVCFISSPSSYVCPPISRLRLATSVQCPATRHQIPIRTRRGEGHMHRSLAGHLLIERINSAVQTQRESVSVCRTYSSGESPPSHRKSTWAAAVADEFSYWAIPVATRPYPNKSPMFVCGHGQTQNPVQKD